MKEEILVYLFAVLLVLQQHKTPNTLISEPPALDSHQKLENCSLVREVGWSLYKAGPYVHEVLVKLGRRWLGSGNLVLVMGPGRMVSVSRGTQFAKGVHCSLRRQKKRVLGIDNNGHHISFQPLQFHSTCKKQLVLEALQAKIAEIQNLEEISKMEGLAMPQLFQWEGNGLRNTCGNENTNANIADLS